MSVGSQLSLSIVRKCGCPKVLTVGKKNTSGGVALSYLQAVALFLNTFLYVHINIQ